MVGLKLRFVPENSRKRSIAKIVGLIALAGLLSGCSELPKDALVDAVTYRACLVNDGVATKPGLNDSSLYSLNQAVVTFGIKKTVSETNPSKFEAVVGKLLKSKCNLIAAVGSRFTDFMVPLASANPETHFLFITEGSDRSLLKADLQNLASYRVDVYEAGLLAGYVAASISENRQLSTVCGNSVNASYLAGVRAGSEAFDLERETSTTVNGGNAAFSDVLLPYGCRDEIPLGTDYRTAFKLVGYGRDLFFDKELELAKPYVAATLIPQAGSRLLEIIAADLESEYIGGTLGSTVATYGNGGLVISDEHNLPLPNGELEKLRALAEEYETSFK